MPLDEKILGFSNRWYVAAFESAETLVLESSIRIRRITAPLFLATKLEAFKGRGGGDYLASRDMEDLLTVIDGRPELSDEVRSQPRDLRAYLARECKALLRDPRFFDALPGHLLPDSASQSRIPLLLRVLEGLSGM